MPEFTEIDISRAIINAYHARLSDAVESDVLIVGAGPAGMTAAYYLAKAERKVVVIEKRLSSGGGVWGGAMGMNVVVVQDQALPVLDECGIRHRSIERSLHVVDAAELACGLTLRALQAGAVMLNLTCLEDVSVHEGRVTGVVINRTTLLDALPVDPITLRTKAVLDATGHDAAGVEKLVRRGLIKNLPAIERHREGPMDAASGEAFVVDRVGEVFPGLWVTGMSVCAVYGGPRMGPIFGGMILSGRRVAEMVLRQLDRAFVFPRDRSRTNLVNGILEVLHDGQKRRNGAVLPGLPLHVVGVGGYARSPRPSVVRARWGQGTR